MRGSGSEGRGEEKRGQRRERLSPLQLGTLNPAVEEGGKREGHRG